MKADLGTSSGLSGVDSGLLALVDEIVKRLEAGESVDLRTLVGDNEERAALLRKLLPTLELLADLGLNSNPELVRALGSSGETGLGVLGDYRLIREVGRGGMGIVYEARQISLGRRVALKVLPFAAAAERQHLARFKTEAQAAASLHHANIVPVFGIGCDRGVHYYAMQFIEGRSLAEVIRELRSDHSSSRPNEAFYRTVASLGIQSAQALEYAHRQGILHRDIKPANLMLDGEGNLWVADFGLARFQNDSGLTLTGDLLGTLRYMSPEQAIARRLVVDHRTDIYGLGVTLYELLALRPAFDDQDRQVLLRKVAFEEPPLLRQVNSAVPRELETIVLKSMAKEPDARYATAAELADDLGRFLAYKPIFARNPNLLDRAAKWSRRHSTLVLAALLLLVITVTGLTVGGALIWREKVRTAGALDAEGKALARAEDREEALRKHLYVAQMNLAQQAWEGGHIRRAIELLEAQQPPPGKDDLRGFEWRYLWRQCQKGLLETLKGHQGAVTRLSFSPDGQTLASGSDDGTLILWDSQTRKATHILRGYEGPIIAVAFSPDSRTVTSTGGKPHQSGELRLSDRENGQTRTFLRQSNVIRATAMSPDGRVLVTLAEPAAELWDAASGASLGAWKVPTTSETRPRSLLMAGHWRCATGRSRTE